MAVTKVKRFEKQNQEAISPTTTVQQDLTLAGQRKINDMWETVQGIIATVIVVANMIVGVAQGLGLVKGVEFPVILSSSLFLVIGFYFSRTNHQAIGGTGLKANQQQPYTGR